MRFYHYLLIVVLALGAGYAGSRVAGTSTATAQAEEGAYDRVMRTGVMRCGYALWPPIALFKNANTGKIEGFAPQIIEELAARLHLKVEWVEETGWSSYIEGLQTKRFDVFCAPAWQNSERGRFLSYTMPIAYSGMHFYARRDDTRFDADLSILNSPEYTLSAMDGEMSQVVANKSFPKAKQLAIPQMGDITQILLAVSTGKADGTFTDPSLAKAFAENNPGAIRQITKEPYATFPNVFSVLIGETKLQQMLNSGLVEMHNQGRIDEIITMHEPDRSLFMPIAEPYTYIAPAPLK